MDGAVTTDSTLDTLTTGSNYFFFDEHSLLHPIALMACLSYDFNVAALHELEPGPFLTRLGPPPPHPSPRVGAGPPHGKGCTSNPFASLEQAPFLTSVAPPPPSKCPSRVGPGLVLDKGWTRLRCINSGLFKRPWVWPLEEER